MGSQGGHGVRVFGSPAHAVGYGLGGDTKKKKFSLGHVISSLLPMLDALSNFVLLQNWYGVLQGKAGERGSASPRATYAVVSRLCLRTQQWAPPRAVPRPVLGCTGCKHCWPGWGRSAWGWSVDVAQSHAGLRGRLSPGCWSFWGGDIFHVIHKE